MIQPATRKSLIQSEASDHLLTYWTKQLSGAPPLLELLTDRPRSSQISNQRAHHSFILSKSFSNVLKKLSEESGSGLDMLLLSAFNIFLHRYTGQEDILMGYPIPNYSIAAFGDLKGQPGNIVVLRTDLSSNPSFLDLLKRVDKTYKEAYLHKDISLERIETAMRQQHGSNHVSLFQAMFNFKGLSDFREDTDGLVSNIESENNSLIDIILSVEESNDGMVGLWNYNANLFESASIARMADHFKILLEGIVANPQQRILQLPILSTVERIQILFEWNNTASAYPADQCIHQLFEQQVERTPNAPAVTLHTSSQNSKQQLTYHELNDRANQLAHYLREQGVGPDVLVGICMKRSMEMVIGLLAVLKAGGAYVPLDPNYPKQRLGFMLNDSKPLVLLTQQQLVKELPQHEAKVVCLDTDWNTIASRSKDNIIAEVRPENLAYVIYTSGSTGVPKGTLIMHRGVVNYLSWCIKYYAVGAGSGAPVNSSIAFDATVTSFFSPLLTGKKVLLLPEEGEIEALSDVLLARNQFSLVKITPAHLEILRHMLPPGEVKEQVNALVIGGEALLGKNLALWHTHARGTRLINEYGPTETVVGCSIYEVPDNITLPDEIPIGRPIANTQMYILDRYLQPVPVGVAGEIYIGGDGVARGYLNRPDLSEQRFIPNPFVDDTNARLYKTGDLARFLSDGNIVFLGRIDHQVKIRGYRIELGEVETALGQHPAIQHLAVIAREDIPGDKRLVAYIVLKQEHTISSNELRDFLREKLPEYMAPSLFVFLKALPLTSNGKVDRNALPIPDQQRPDLEKKYVAPRDAVELELTKIFGKCLNIDSIGVQDNFFELGGTSVQAAVAFSQIRKTFGKQLPLAILIQAPSIEQLAVFLRNEGSIPNWSSLVPIQPNGSKPPLFCMHAGAGTVLFYREFANHLGTDQPVYGLQAKGLNGSEPPHTRIEDMAAHYIHEMRTVQPNGPYYLAGYCLGGILAFEMAQQLMRDGHEIAFLGSINAVSPGYIHQHSQVAMNDDEDVQRHVKPEPVKTTARRNKNAVSKKMAKLFHILKILKRVLRFKARGLAYQFYLGLGRPLPESLGKKYFLDTNGKIANAYVPKVYRGNMVVFRSPDIYPDPHLGWTSMVAGGITTFDIPGKHLNRREIMNEPFVQQLAAEVKKHLEGYTKHTPNGNINQPDLSIFNNQQAEPAKNYIEPRDAIELKLTKIFKKCLHIHSIGVKDDFFELGGTSVHAAVAFSQIKKVFGKQLPLAVLIQAPTIEKLADFLRNEDAVPHLSSLVPIQPNGIKPILFCIHGGWGNVLFYRHLANRLPPDQPVYGLQAKGLIANETNHTKIEEMAAHYIQEIRTVQPKGPYYLGGYCFGAIVAFEMAQQLIRAGEEIALLASFNGIAPSQVKSKLVNNKQSLAHTNVKAKLLHPLRILKRKLRSGIILGKLWIQLKARWIAYRFYFASGLPMPDRLRRFYVVDGIIVSQLKYIPQKYPGTLTVFRSPKIYKRPHLGWTRLIEGEIKTFDISGDPPKRRHMMYEPYVRHLAEEVKKHLAGYIVWAST